MAVINCKMCGSPLPLNPGVTVVECEYCGREQTVPSMDNEKKLTLFARAERLRTACEFDKAAGVFETIVADFPEEAEAYWGLVLCKYGIEYVDDPATGDKIPTCHRSSFDSVFDDPDYEQAYDNADVSSRKVYRAEGKRIEDVRRGIISVSANEDPYDIFICYKETAENGDRTLDSVLAQDIYDALTDKGYRVFFARITLEDKLGQEYEPYIFAALNSARIMLAVGTEFEYYNAVWVKNEWSRFLKLMAKDKSKHLIPCFKGLDAYDMPKEFNKLQAQDLGKVGAMQDLLRGIEKLLPRQKEVTKEIVKEQVVVQQSVNALTAPLLQRAYIFLEDGKWDDANAYCERVLDMDPENAQAYLGKLMAEQKVKKQEQLKDCLQPFDESENYRKVYRYGDSAVKKWIEDAIVHINERNRNTACEEIYAAACAAYSGVVPECGKLNSNLAEVCRKAVKDLETIFDYKDAIAMVERCKELIYNHGSVLMQTATSEKQFRRAGKAFGNIPTYETYRDAQVLHQECERRAAEIHNEGKYQELCCKQEYANDAWTLRSVSRGFRELNGYRDSRERAEMCQKRSEKLIKEQKEYAESLQQRINWKNAALCQHCGGIFKGFFSPKCASCGRPKDY